MIDQRERAKLLERLALKRQELAEAGMKYPKAQPFEHGQQVGEWQGIGTAIEIIREMIRDEDED